MKWFLRLQLSTLHPVQGKSDMVCVSSHNCCKVGLVVSFLSLCPMGCISVSVVMLVVAGLLMILSCNVMASLDSDF